MSSVVTNLEQKPKRTLPLAGLRNRHFFAVDLCLLALTPVVALFLRVDSLHAARPYFSALLVYTALAMAVRLLVFYCSGLYSRYWQYATVDELARTFFAVTISSALVALPLIALNFSDRTQSALPRSLPILDGMLVLFAIGSTRFALRLTGRFSKRPARQNAKRTLIIGAGLSGQSIVRDVRANPDADVKLVGFLDDDNLKQNLHILNLPVLGGRADLPRVVAEQQIAQVIIAMPSASGKVIRECLQLCEKAGLPAMSVPGLSAIINGNISINRLRKVEIEDLLRREPVATDIEAVGRLIRGKRVLVTGGGGSIGSELCRQVLRSHPSDLAVLGHGENSIFDIYNELLSLRDRSGAQADPLIGGPRTNIQAYIADIRFADRVNGIVQEFMPDIIFHAAAHKHVPLMEANPAEAISNNVFGTKNLVDAAATSGVPHFVMISTDKAVNPTSVMGASKRVAEQVVLRAARQTGRAYVTVRFGNVLGSRGSVVPTFKKQIAAGGPVTVTHPDMTRYFMTIPEAVQLVLQASVLGRGGEVFMLDMGEPVKIVDLASDLIRLCGLEVKRDIDIEYTGLRPGEKLFEELLLSGENYEPTPHTKLRIARNASASPLPILDAVLEQMKLAAYGGRRIDVLNCLQMLVPEFQPDEVRAAGAALVQQTPEAGELTPAYAVVQNVRELGDAHVAFSL